MGSTKPLTVTLILLWLLLAIAPASAKSIEDHKWIRMASENFTVHSMVNKRKTREILLHLEATFQVFPSLSESSDSLVPTSIFILESDEDMEELGLDPDRVAGLFVPGLRSNAMIIRDSRFIGAGQIAIHEFIHYLLRNLVRYPFPKWYDEGYADYVAASPLTSGTFSLGAPSELRLYGLERYDWLPMASIIDAEQMPPEPTADQMLMFYAQSWILVHYLQSRRNGPLLTLQNFQRYGRLRHAGESETAAFEQGFGLAIADLEDILRSYIHEGRYRIAKLPITELEKSFKPTLTKLRREEICIRLADLLLRPLPGDKSAFDRRRAKAGALLDKALAEENTRPRAQILSAGLAASDGDIERAEALLSSAMAALHDDFYAQLDAALFYLAWMPESAEAAEPFLESARQADPEDPEFAFVYGIYLMKQGESADAIPWLTDAANAAPASHETRINLALAHADIGNVEDAARYAREILLFPHLPGRIQEFVVKMIEELETVN